MIPGIQDILMGLLRGDYTAAQCEAWINTHIELGAENADLRDHFAGQAMAALIVNPQTISASVPISARAYELADAMIEARAAS